MYGMYNRHTKRFVFGISKPTAKEAEAELFRLIGYNACHNWYSPRPIPKNYKNAPNPLYVHYHKRQVTG